jgi:hypothetical protein
MERIKNKKLAGGAFIVTSFILFGKETLLWVWNKSLDTVSTGAVDMSLTAIPWQNLIASFFGLAGIGLLFWPNKKITKPSRRSLMYNLYQSADNFVSRVRHNRQLSWFERDRGENRVDLARDGISLALQFQNSGIPAPNLDERSAEKICVGLEHYFSALIPFMRDGHVAQVDSMAAIQVERASTACKSFEPARWFNEQERY